MVDEQLAARQATLQNGQTATIRPLGEDDRTALLAFGQALPQDDLLYLEDDFQSPETIARLVNAHQAENWRQIVAESDGEIVGYSSGVASSGRNIIRNREGDRRAKFT